MDNSSESLDAVLGNNVLSDFCSVLDISQGLIRCLAIGFLLWNNKSSTPFSNKGLRYVRGLKGDSLILIMHANLRGLIIAGNTK